MRKQCLGLTNKKYIFLLIGIYFNVKRFIVKNFLDVTMPSPNVIMAIRVITVIRVRTKIIKRWVCLLGTQLFLLWLF